MSADASLVNSTTYKDDISPQQGQGLLHSKSDQQLLPFRSLGIGGLMRNSGLKFSRSENQLANICNTSGSSGLSSNTPSIGGISESEMGEGISDSNNKKQIMMLPTHPAGGRKVSVPIQYFGSRDTSNTNTSDDSVESSVSAKNAAALEKLHFNPNIYSTHSQSDSTIQHSISSSKLGNAASVHNLFRQYASSSQINNVIPSVVVSVENEVIEKIVDNDNSTLIESTLHPTNSTNPAPTVMRTSPSPVSSCNSSPIPGSKPMPAHNKVQARSSEPPPVPPRKTIPPPVPSANLDLRVFPTTHHPSSSATTTSSDPSIPAVPSAIIQVFAAYDCGLTTGTSVRLKVTSQTTARQVVDLVVKQLNKEIASKGLSQPIYERTQEFCLVALLGVRERCLRNDFKPLNLQIPWKNGKLFVRKKNDVTAAIAMNSRAAENSHL